MIVVQEYAFRIATLPLIASHAILKYTV